MGSTPWSSKIFWMGGETLRTPLCAFRVYTGGTLGTNPRRQPPSAYQVSRCWVIWIFLVRDEFAKHSISGTKYSVIKLLSDFSPN
jgi:hypothetical protein